MDAFPAFFPLAGRSVAIAGEGEAAEAKVRLFAGSPATLIRLTGADALDARSYAGMTLAFIAADDDAWAMAAAEAAVAGDMEGAKERLRAALCDTPMALGAVQYIDARGPADLLTLRAARALAAADVLACDPGAHADVLALARRDAERLDGRTADQLAELAAEGLTVARLVTGTAWRSEQAALDAKGVNTQVLPIAS